MRRIWQISTMFAHLDPCFRCHRCGTTQASLNHETAHLCACRNSGPIWTPYRRVRVDWGSIVAVAALVAALFAIRDEIRFWSDPRAMEWRARSMVVYGLPVA